MIKAGGVLKMIYEEKVMMESLMCLRRAGSDIILTYVAHQTARCLCGEKRWGLLLNDGLDDASLCGWSKWNFCSVMFPHEFSPFLLVFISRWSLLTVVQIRLNDSVFLICENGNNARILLMFYCESVQIIIDCLGGKWIFFGEWISVLLLQFMQSQVHSFK